jgi:tripartite-type tricarboxylate transporter receptor subunit TctC
VFAKLPYDPVKDFAPVSLVGEAPFVLVAHPSVPVKTLRELVALAKARPDSLTYSSSGVGGIAHLGFVLLNNMAGTRMVHVPYKGSPLQTQAAVAGEVAIAFDSIPVTQPFIKAGRVRALGIGSVKRSALLPEVPTVAEGGLTGFELASWYAIFAPANTPADSVRLLQRTIVRALEGSAVREQFAAFGAEPVGGTPEELAAVVQRDLRKWAQVARDGGVKPE